MIILGLSVSCSPDEENTKNKNAERHKQFFLESMIKIKYHADSIYFESKDPHRQNEELKNKFTLRKNDSFILMRDKHGSTKCELLNFDEKSLTVGYASEFNHSSFGKNKITKDTGIIKLEYK